MTYEEGRAFEGGINGVVDGGINDAMNTLYTSGSWEDISARDRAERGVQLAHPEYTRPLGDLVIKLDGGIQW